MRLAILALTCFAFFGTTAANAQHCHRRAVPVHHRVWVPAIRPHYQAATYAQSYARGRATLLRSQGEHNLLNSHARINNAKAFRHEIENDVTRTEAYFHKQEINRAYRYGDRVRRTASVPAGTRTTIADAEHLLETLLDDGHVAWPAALTGPAFAQQRSAVEQVLLPQTANGSLASADRATLTDSSRELTCLLKEHIHECLPQQYVDARLFLKSLSQFAKG